MTKVIGGKIPAKEHAKLKIEDALDDLFDRLVFARFDREMTRKKARADCLFLPEDMGPMWVAAPRGGHDIDGFFAPEEINSPDVVWPVSIGTAWPSQDDEWGRHIHCCYWQTTAAKTLRGNWRRLGAKNVAIYEGYLHGANEFAAARMVGTWAFGAWRSAQYLRYDAALSNATNGEAYRRENFAAVGEDDVGFRVAMGQSIALTYRYEWGAQFSIGNSVRLIVPTTPRGILELFNDRNKPADRDRRAALRHWVRQHAREHSKGNFTNVRRHLRGEVDFSWRGFDVKIRPSAFDAEQNGDKAA